MRIKFTDTGQELRTVPDTQKPNKLLFPFYKEANRGSESLSDLANSTEDYEIKCGAARGCVKPPVNAQGMVVVGILPCDLTSPNACLVFILV